MSLKLVVVCSCLLVMEVAGHGRLFDPPSRSTLWRKGFAGVPNYNDNELFCGGFARQWETNGGKCGVCGDPWDGKRDNEAGGIYAKGVIVANYKQATTVTIVVQITANHKGYFEFRLCPHNNPSTPVSQECLDRHLLRLTDGTTRYLVSSSRNGMYPVDVVLPAEVTCKQCVIQWKYNTGNSWGCANNNGKKTCCIGCGPQEQFYGCADVAISAQTGSGTSAPETSSTPTTTSTVTTTTPAPETSSTSTTASTVTTTTTAPPTTSTTTSSPCATSPSTSSSSVAKTSTGRPESDGCHSVGPWEGDSSMTDWCIDNCSLGSCPETHCSDECRDLDK